MDFPWIKSEEVVKSLTRGDYKEADVRKTQSTINEWIKAQKQKNLIRAIWLLGVSSFLLVYFLLCMLSHAGENIPLDALKFWTEISPGTHPYVFTFMLLLFLVVGSSFWATRKFEDN